MEQILAPRSPHAVAQITQLAQVNTQHGWPGAASPESRWPVGQNVLPRGIHRQPVHDRLAELGFNQLHPVQTAVF